MQHHYSPNLGHITYTMSDVAMWRYAAMCQKAKKEGKPNPAYDEDTTKVGSHKSPSKYQQARTENLRQEDMELIEMIAADTLIAHDLKHQVRKLEQRLHYLGELHQLEQRVAELRQQETSLKASCRQWRKTWAMHAALYAKESHARSPLGLGNAQTPTYDLDPALQHSTTSLLGDSDSVPTCQVSLEASHNLSSTQQVTEADYTADSNCQVTSESVQRGTLRGWLRSSVAPANAAGHSCQIKSEDVQPLSLVRWLRQWVAPSREDSKAAHHSSSSCSEPEPATTDPGITDTDFTCVVKQNPLALPEAGEPAPDSSRVNSTSCSDRLVASGRNSNTDSATYRCSSTSGVDDFYHDNLSFAADTVSAGDVTAMPGPDPAEELPQRGDSPWQADKPLLHEVLHISHVTTGPLQPSGLQSHLRKLQQHCKNIFSKSQKTESAPASPARGSAATKASTTSGTWRRSSSSGRSSVWDWGSDANSGQALMMTEPVAAQQA